MLIFLRSTPEFPLNNEPIKLEMRIGDRNPVWGFRTRLTAVPSVRLELGVQVLDAKRHEVAGEVSIPLRSLLDQRDHDDWHVLPPTLRQQLLEKKPRSEPARIRVGLKLTHTKVGPALSR